MQDGWYYQTNGHETGPCTEDQLRELLRVGTLKEEDVVWSAAGKLKRSVAGVVRTSGRGTHPVDRTKQEDSTVASEANLDINDFFIEGSSSAAAAVSAPRKRRESAEELITFLIRSGTTTIGPLTAESLTRMADAGKIAADDFVKRSDDSEWQPAAEVPEVMAAGLLAGGQVQASPSPPEKPRQEPRKRSARAKGESRNTAATSRPRRRKQTWVEKRAAEIRRQRELEARQEERIFADALADDVAPRSGATAERPLNQNSSAPAASPDFASPAVQPNFQQPITPAAMPAAMTSPRPADIPRQAWTPPPKSKARRRSGNDFPVRGAAIGVAVAALLALIVFVGPSLLSFGGSFPAREDVAKQLSEFADQYETASGSEAAWQGYVQEIRSTAGGWVKAYRESPGQRTPRDIQLQEAATALIQLVNSGIDDREKHQQFLEIVGAKLTES